MFKLLPCSRFCITKTCLYNVDPLKPNFHIVKLGFTGVYIIFLFLLKNIDCGYSLEPPRRGGSNEYPQSMFWADIWKISAFLYLKIFSFLRWNLLYVWIGVFRNCGISYLHSEYQTMFLEMKRHRDGDRSVSQVVLAYTFFKPGILFPKYCGIL